MRVEAVVSAIGEIETRQFNRQRHDFHAPIIIITIHRIHMILTFLL